MSSRTNDGKSVGSESAQSTPQSANCVPDVNLDQAPEVDFSKYIGVLKGKIKIHGDIFSTGVKD